MRAAAFIPEEPAKSQFGRGFGRLEISRKTTGAAGTPLLLWSNRQQAESVWKSEERRDNVERESS